MRSSQDLSFPVNNLKVVASNAASILKLSNNNIHVSSYRLLDKRTGSVLLLNYAWIRFNSSSVTSLIKDSYHHTSLFLAQVKYWASLIKEQDDGYIEIKLSERKLNVSREFIEWFRGFTDAEGCFRIKRSGKNFSFCFSISLHRDDVDV